MEGLRKHTYNKQCAHYERKKWVLSDRSKKWQIQELSVGGTLFIVIIPTFPHCCTRSISMYHTFISATLIRWLITENVPWYDLFQVPFYWGKGEGILKPFRRRQIWLQVTYGKSRGKLPVMACTGRLRPKGATFSGFRYIKGRDST